MRPAIREHNQGVAEDLTEIAAELYALLPGEFVRARDDRAKALRSDGDRELATQVKALRRPTQAAWLVNLLAQRPDSLTPLLELGHDLRAAQSELDVPTMKTLAARRPGVVAELVTAACRAATDVDPDFQESEGLRGQVSATLTAAVADPLAEQAVASGRLVTALTYAGFGEVEIGDAVATPLRVVPDDASAATGPTDSAVESSVRRTDDSDDEPEPAGSTEDELTAARDRVAAAAQALEVAEAAMAQARARRAAARRTWESARDALEALENE